MYSNQNIEYEGKYEGAGIDNISLIARILAKAKFVSLNSSAYREFNKRLSRSSLKQISIHNTGIIIIIIITFFYDAGVSITAAWSKTV